MSTKSPHPAASAPPTHRHHHVMTSSLTLSACSAPPSERDARRSTRRRILLGPDSAAAPVQRHTAANNMMTNSKHPATCRVAPRLLQYTIQFALLTHSAFKGHYARTRLISSALSTRANTSREHRLTSTHACRRAVTRDSHKPSRLIFETVCPCISLSVTTCVTS